MAITVHQSKWHDNPEDLNSQHHYNYYELSYWFVSVYEDSYSNSTSICEAGLHHKRVCVFIFVIYCAECAFLNCYKTNYVFHYSRLSELRTLSFPPLWMGQFSQVWEYAVCYRWNSSTKYRRCCSIFPVSRNSTKEYEKNIYTLYIHSVQHQSPPSPIFCSTT